MKRPIFKPADSRGWIGLGCYTLVVGVFVMIVAKPSLLDSDAFLILATAIVITGWVQGPVGWAYQATKGGQEQAESTARIAEQSVGLAPHPTPTPQPVEVVNTPQQPVPVEPQG